MGIPCEAASFHHSYCIELDGRPVARHVLCAGHGDLLTIFFLEEGPFIHSYYEYTENKAEELYLLNPKCVKVILRKLLSYFFHLLYHELAWAYDLVANIVSLGEWKKWTLNVLPYIEGPSILEIGHGPGHIQKAISDLGYSIFGVDESWHMNLIAKNRLVKNTLKNRKNHDTFRLTRALGQQLPFAPNSFSCIVATFPTKYFFKGETCSEISRVLVPGGIVVILPLAWLTGAGIISRIIAFLFRVTGETPPINSSVDSFVSTFKRARMNVDTIWVNLPTSRLLLITARKL